MTVTNSQAEFEAWLDKEHPTWRDERYHGSPNWHRQREAFRAGWEARGRVGRPAARTPERYESVGQGGRVGDTDYG